MKAAFPAPNFRFSVVLAATACLALAGCDNLKSGTKIKPLTESKFFPDGQSSRQPPAHSIAQNNLRIDTVLSPGATRMARSPPRCRGRSMPPCSPAVR